MGTHPIFESDFDCLTDLCRTTLRFVRNVTLSVSRPTRLSKAVPKMPSKQASISSFFKPKTSNVTVQSTSKAEKPKVKKPEVKKSEIIKSPKKKPDNKENVGKMIQNMDLKSDSDSDEEIIKPRKNRRAKVIDSSDSEEEAVKPAKKKQKLEPKKEPEASQSSSE